MVAPISDDGFTIGEFSLSDSAQLYAAAALGGALNTLAYVAARRVLPEPLRIPLWGLVGGAAVGAVVVHTDGVDFTVRLGETIGLLGRNGMGKTTLLRSLMGLTRPRSGTVRVRGTDMTRSAPHAIARPAQSAARSTGRSNRSSPVSSRRARP